MPWMTRLVADEMGIRRIPPGLRGVILFDDTLVSKHDDIFTTVDGRIVGWDSFRRYWVHRWAADRLWQQLGIDVCKTLLDSFDDAVDGTEDDLDRSENELKVPCREFYRLLATEVFLAGHTLRDLLLAAVEPEDNAEDSISWGMYMHALVFRLHEEHRHHRNRPNQGIRGAGGELALASGYSSGDSSGGDSSTDSGEEEVDVEVDVDVDEDDNKDYNKDIEDESSTTMVVVSSPKMRAKSPLLQATTAAAAATATSATSASNASSRRNRSPRNRSPSSNLSVRPNINSDSTDNKKRRRKRRGGGDFRAGGILQRGETRQHELIKRLAAKQRYLRNLELDLQRKDDASANVSSRRKSAATRKDDLGEIERLRGRVHHLRRQVGRLNRKVSALTGGEHALVTVTSGISLVEEAARIAKSEDARSRHKQHLQERVAQNKRKLLKEQEQKRKLVEKKAAQKFDTFQQRNSQRSLSLQRPASAAPGGRRSSRGRRSGQTNDGGKGKGIRRPMSAGVVRKKTRMGNRRTNTGTGSSGSSRAVGGGVVGSTSTSRSTTPSTSTSKSTAGLRRSTRPVDGANNDDNDDDEAVTAAELDQRMHDFGMPGYGTSRAWQELKRFFAERVRINKAQAAKKRKRQQKILWKRESEHMDRVARRKNARTRTSHSRHVKMMQETQRIQDEKKQRIEMDKLKKEEEFQRQHKEDMSWIQSARFSPRARSVAYDSMRKLTMSETSTQRSALAVGSITSGAAVRQQRPGTATGTRGYIQNTGGSSENRGSSNMKRPTSANPRLRRNNRSAAATLASNTNVAQQQYQQQHQQYHHQHQHHYQQQHQQNQQYRPHTNTTQSSASFTPGRPMSQMQLTIPTRPNTARTRSGPHAGRGAKHMHLVAELEDAKQLLDHITEEQENKRLEKEVVGSSDLLVDEVAGKNPETATDVLHHGSSHAEKESTSLQSSHHNAQEGSLVNVAIIQAVQLQMLRQWPQKRMSLRVRQLVHAQLRGRARQRARNVELDHATQRLNDKESTNKKVVHELSTLPRRQSERDAARRKQLKEPQSPFIRSTAQTGASPLIRFRRMTSQNQF